MRQGSYFSPFLPHKGHTALVSTRWASAKHQAPCKTPALLFLQHQDLNPKTLQKSLLGHHDLTHTFTSPGQNQPCHLVSHHKPPTERFWAALEINSNKTPAAFVVPFVSGFILPRAPSVSHPYCAAPKRQHVSVLYLREERREKMSSLPGILSFAILLSSRAPTSRWKCRLARTASLRRCLLFTPALPGKIMSWTSWNFTPMADRPIELVLPRFILAICIKFCHLFTQPMVWVCQIYIYYPALGCCKVIFF